MASRLRWNIRWSLWPNPTSMISYPRLWATRRVGYLLDQIRLHGENKELKEEVTTTGQKIWHRDPIHRLSNFGG